MILRDFGPDVPQREFYTAREIEALSGLSHATIYRLINQGRLEAKKVGVKTIISAASYRRFIADLPAACPPPRPAPARRSHRRRA